MPTGWVWWAVDSAAQRERERWCHGGYGKPDSKPPRSQAPATAARMRTSSRSCDPTALRERKQKCEARGSGARRRRPPSHGANAVPVGNLIHELGAFRFWPKTKKLHEFFHMKSLRTTMIMLGTDRGGKRLKILK